MHKLSARLHVSLFELGKRLSAEDRGSEGILGSSVPIVGVGVLAGVFIPTFTPLGDFIGQGVKTITDTIFANK
jgi:hypothetical protein